MSRKKYTIDRVNKLHDQYTQDIGMHPYNYLNIGNIILSTCESNIIINNNLIGQPDDLVFDPSTMTLYNIEYKVSNKQESHAKHQLQRTKEYLNEMFPNYKIKNLYIHENYKIVEIK